MCMFHVFVYMYEYEYEWVRLNCFDCILEENILLTIKRYYRQQTNQLVNTNTSVQAVSQQFPY